MARIEYRTCEPFRAWNRLEQRPRRYDFDQTLKAEVHDPLWNLTRQWQFGEFKGEDTGSPVFARTLVETTRVIKYQPLAGPVKAYADEWPLEAKVEQQTRMPGYRDRVQAGAYWLKLLDHFGTAFNQTKQPAQPAYDKPAYKTRVLDLFPLETPELNESTPELHAQSARLMSNRRMMNFVRSFAGRVPDGWLLYGNLNAGMAAFVNAVRLNAAHSGFVRQAAEAFKGWIGSAFPDIPDEENAWNSSQLAYQVKCALPEKSGNNTVLAANEYTDGRLDWHSFDAETRSVPAGDLLTATANDRKQAIESKVVSFIPSPAGYGGMPVNRFWEFEDGKVDLGNITADTTDLSRIIVVEYAMIYGNNWFLIPYPLRTGSLAAVKGIVVTDTFGQKTFVEAAIQGESDDWSGWGMFNLTAWDAQKSGAVAADTRIFLPPAVPKIQESAPVEEVLFLRDETANMVWAVENKIDNLLSAGMDGHKAAAELAAWLETPDEADPGAVAEEAVLQYRLGNTVPENWIPFISIHLDGQNRAIQLQRASMPRMLDGARLPVRPRTRILREGFGYDPDAEVSPYVNPEADKQLAPYFVHEEEVPRAGARVTGSYQRTRWYNGEIIRWFGYKKTLGKGEGNSGLKFDQVEWIKRKK